VRTFKVREKFLVLVDGLVAFSGALVDLAEIVVGEELNCREAPLYECKVRNLAAASHGNATKFDFGCGVGRVLIPLAARCREVTGVDVSPAMLEEARRNCDAAGASQVRLIRSDDNLSAIEGDFDFVHSYIVLQHIPVERGERLVRELAGRLAPDGIGVFHVVYSRAPASPVRRFAHWARTRVPGAHWALNIARGRPARTPMMQSNPYSVTRLLDILSNAGCPEVLVRFTNHDGYRGVLLFARKAAAIG